MYNGVSDFYPEIQVTVNETGEGEDRGARGHYLWTEAALFSEVSWELTESIFVFPVFSPVWSSTVAEFENWNIFAKYTDTSYKFMALFLRQKKKKSESS